MEFPRGNKIPTGVVASLKEKTGENALLLQELLATVQWRSFFRYYVILFGMFLASVFALIVTVRVAFWLTSLL